MTIKVLHVLEAPSYGTARHVVGVIRHVEAEHVVVMPSEGGGRYQDTGALGEMKAAGAQLRRIDMRRSPFDPRNLAAVARIRQLIQREQPDIVHGHSSIGGAIARVAAARTGAARFYTPNGLYPSQLAFLMERMLGRITDRFIASSQSEAELAELHRIVPKARISVVPNAIELDVPEPSLSLRAELELAESTPLVGNVGRLAPQKAPEIFVRACGLIAAAVPEAHYVLVGDGPLSELVEREVAEAGLHGRLHMIPLLSGGESVMGELDVFALPSRYEAGAAFAPMEAMRAGTPVVLTQVVGSRDAVEDGRSGLLVAPDDPRALADAVIRVLRDPDLRRRLGNAGRERVIDKFDIRKVAGRLGELYRESAAR